MTRSIPEDAIEAVRNGNDIVEVVEEYVQLKRQGRNYVGLCPFHEEKTPSFTVSKEKQIYHCFGCGKGGDVIQFLIELENFSFSQALEYLAERIHYTLPVRQKQSSLPKEANQLFTVYHWLTKYYHHMLKYSDEGKEAREYLYNRGITDETIDRFQLGFAPNDSSLTVAFLKQKDFHLAFLVKNGLLSTQDQQHYVDVFRGRIIFPIHNHLGKPVAFGGRALGNAEPKYLNSSEHALFQKSKLLYNFSLAKNHIRKLNEVIIFEGYLDVLAADQADIKNVVATLGTALTEPQAALLNRYVDRVVVCYDGDDAGVEASFHAATLLKNAGCEVRVSRMKEQLDPDDYIRKYGGEAFQKEIIAVSDSYISFLAHYERRNFNLAVDSERLKYIEKMITHLATIESALEREYYIKEIADEFHLSVEIITQDVEKIRKQQNKQKKDKLNRFSNTNNKSVRTLQNNILPAHVKAERMLIAYMLRQQHIIDLIQEELGVAFNVDEHKVILTHLYALYEKNAYVDVRELIEKISDQKIKNLVTELAFLEINHTISEEEIFDYVRLIRKEASEHQYLRYLREKQKRETDPLIAAQIGLEIIEIEKKLKRLS